MMLKELIHQCRRSQTLATSKFLECLECVVLKAWNEITITVETHYNEVLGTIKNTLL